MVNIYCRIYQYVMKLVIFLIPWRSPVLLQDKTELVRHIKENKHQKILLVTGPNIYHKGLIDPYLKIMKDNDIDYVVFYDIKANPSDIEVVKGLKLYEEYKCDGIVCIGGGSPMDCAKAIGAMHVSHKSINQLHGNLKVHHKLPKMYMIPTTAATGSETTAVAVITDSKTKRKAAIVDICLMPDYCLLDASLTLGLSPYLTAINAMDALTHAIEAYVNHLYNSKLENELALKAIKLIYDNLYSCCLNGENIEYRQALSLAAFYAGRAFTRGSVGYVHALGHAISSLYNNAHAETMAIILPLVLEKYGTKVDRYLKDIAKVCDLKESKDFIEWIKIVNHDMKIPFKIANLKKEDFNKIIKLAIKEAHPLYPTPVIWSYEDFKSVLNNLVVY